MVLLLTVVAVFVFLVLNEAWVRYGGYHGEVSRKFIHITVGSFAAFWPFFLSWDQIRLLSFGFLLGVGVSKYFGIFRAIHSVPRPTWGEVFFAVVTGVLTFVTHDKWIFAIALLQMSVADGLAAIIGTKLGKRKYKIYDHVKSYEGSATFFVCSLIILVAYSLLHHHLQPGSLVFLAALATIIENVGIHGSDNLLVPLAVALLLS